MKISLITISYNAQDTIADTIESVLSQTYSDTEYIVIDGNSTDGTVGIIQKYGNKITKFISETDQGLYDAINKGIRLATGDIVGLINADDYYSNNNVLQTICETFANNNIDCCYGNITIVKRDRPTQIVRKWQSRDFKPGLFAKSWTPAHPTFFCKRDIFEKYGYYRLDLPITADIELMYRFLEINRLRSKFINNNLVIMRTGGASSSGIRSTLSIIKEVRRSILNDDGKYVLFKYLFFKALKLKEYLFTR